MIHILTLERNANILIISKYRRTCNTLISEMLSYVTDDVLILISIHELDITSPTGSNVTRLSIFLEIFDSFEYSTFESIGSFRVAGPYI